MEEKKDNSRLIIILIILISIMLLVAGIVIGNNMNKSSGGRSNKGKITVGISNTMKDFMNYCSENGSNCVATPGNRKILINLELESDKSEANDDGVKYVDYLVYKNKYEEIFGEVYSLSYDLEQETSFGPDINSCKNYPNIDFENKVCWSGNLEEFNSTIEIVISNQTQKDDILVVDGRYTKTFTNNTINNGTFKMIYKIVDGFHYLKEMSLTKN